MYATRIALPWVMALMLAGPVAGQSPPGMLQGGTYNTPAGAGASAPGTPSGNPNAPFSKSGQPSRLSPQSFLNRDILRPNRGIWWQQFQRQTRKGIPPLPGSERESRVIIKVRVPTAATQLWVNDQPTRQKGLERVFMTPPLQPGTYRYRFRASWLADRAPVSALRAVIFQPDTSLVVDFTKKSRPAAP